MFGRLAVLVSCLAVAVPSSGAITGTVMDADGNPVAGARVTAFQGHTSAEQRTRLISEAPERKPIGSSLRNRPAAGS